MRILQRPIRDRLPRPGGHPTEAATRSESPILQVFTELLLPVFWAPEIKIERPPPTGSIRAGTRPNPQVGWLAGECTCGRPVGRMSRVRLLGPSELRSHLGPRP